MGKFDTTSIFTIDAVNTSLDKSVDTCTDLTFDFEEVIISGDIIELEAALFDTVINNNYEWHLTL